MSADHRTERLSVALTEIELEQVKENALWFGLKVSEFLRHVALGGTIDWGDKDLKKKAQERRREVAA